jgi:hypothetical protein
MMDPAGPQRLASLLSAAPQPSAFLDACLRAWADWPGGGRPTASLEAAIALQEKVAPDALWSLAGQAALSSATLLRLRGRVCCVRCEGATPALALLAALVTAVEGPRARSS